MFSDSYVDKERWTIAFCLQLELISLFGAVAFLWAAIYKTDSTIVSLLMACIAAAYGSIFVRLEQVRKRLLAKRKSTT